MGDGVAGARAAFVLRFPELEAVDACLDGFAARELAVKAERAHCHAHFDVDACICGASRDSNHL